MATLDARESTTANLNNDVKEFNVAAQTLDSAKSGKGETFWDFPDADRDLGYLKTIPEYAGALNNLSIWVAGKGVTTEDDRTEFVLQNMTGHGADTFTSICKNLLVQKKALGDSFAEVIRDDKTGELLNLKPLYTGDVRIVQNSRGIIVRYEEKTGGRPRHMAIQKTLHLVNDRIGNEIHGTSGLNALKSVIDSRHEALSDERKIRHRELALGILYVDSDNTETINKVKKQYATAVNNGDVLVLPKDVAELKDSGVSPRDRLDYIRYLENQFYQAVRVPRVISTSEGFTEAGGKVGFLTFEPIYVDEQTQLEDALFNQVGLKVKFNRPPSLHGVVSEDEEKNVGQTGFQPNDVQAQAGRVE